MVRVKQKQPHDLHTSPPRFIYIYKIMCIKILTKLNTDQPKAL